MKALVTGAEGFVGPHLVRHLQDSGDEVVTIDRASGVDICDYSQLKAALCERSPEVIYHLAGDSDVGGSWNNPLSTFKVNAEGTLNVLHAAREANVERVLCVGSADVYGKVLPAELPLSETSDLRPTSPYAASKVAADFLALQAHLGFGQHTIRVRAFNHLGPGQSERFVGPAIAARIARNERDGNKAIPVGNLTPKRDITDVRDVVRAYRMLMDSGVGGEVYNVCSGTAISVEQLATHLLGLSNHEMDLVPDPELQRPVDVPILTGDNTKLVGLTGWEPSYDLATTLEDVMNTARSRVS